MKSRTFSRALAITAVILLATAPLAAQEPQLPKNVISANPFGLLLEFFNAEYERAISESSTIGIGGSTFETEVDELLAEPRDERYLNADVFYRFYPSGQPLNGWAFGVKAGVTDVTDAGTYVGMGFDVNRSWLLGKRNNFYVGLGFGLKRLFGTDDDDIELTFIPTIRIINVGVAF